MGDITGPYATDIPDGGSYKDYGRLALSSSRDLIDHFPVRLDIGGLLDLFPPERFGYSLSYRPEPFMQTGGYQAYRSPLLRAIWHPEADISPDGHSIHSGDWLRDGAKSATLISRATVLVNPSAETPGAPSRVRLPDSMLNAARSNSGLVWISSGLASGNVPTPLVLAVIDLTGDTPVASLELPMRIGSVEDMYRYKYLNENPFGGTQGGIPTSPRNWPDGDRNGKHFVFLHGYSVSGKQARGTFAEVFKRLFWCGSNAMFTGIAWHGNESQIMGGGTPDYWRNVHNAFRTSLSLRDTVNELPGELKNIAAHSLGNMVVSSAIADHGLRVANYCMLNAAVAVEAYSPGAPEETNMIHPFWRTHSYDPRLRACEWHKLFTSPAGDARKGLTWRERFAPFPNAWNFHSSGEEVLRNGEGPEPATWDVVTHQGTLAWAKQELSKGQDILGGGGILHAAHGGWEFNPSRYVYDDKLSAPRRMKSIETVLISNEQLRTEPFFKRFNQAALMDETTGSATAADYDTRADVLAEAIPATTFAAGANPIIEFKTEDFADDDRNFDMPKALSANGWPAERTYNSDPKLRGWIHGDFKDVSFLYTHKLYEKMTAIGNLNQE